MFQDYKVAYMRDHVKVKRELPFTMLRQGVAYMHALSARQIPHAAMNMELDVTRLMEYCKTREREIAAAAEKMTDDILFLRAIHKTNSGFFMKAVAHSLYHTPCMNAFLDYSPLRSGGVMYHAEDINIGFTVHTKMGVVRPVMRNAHEKPITQVAREMRELTRRARRTDPEELYREAARLYLWPSIKQLDWRSLLPGFLLLRSAIFNGHKTKPEFANVPREERLRASDILGATCSIANIGMMIPGHQTVTVLLPPEVMMFGLGDIHDAPRVRNGEIVVRKVLTLCATMDHRAYDAGEAFPFGHHLNRYLDNPELIYEWKEGDPI